MKKFIIVLCVLMSWIVSGQIVNIPDANFKAALLPIADTNNDGEIQVSEAEALLILDVSNQDIVSMEGIQSFINLTNLDCSDNQISTIEISQNSNLEFLSLEVNNLTGIDVTQNQNLEQLFVSFNSLNALNFSQSPNLIWLSCSFNEISTLDLSLSPSLAYLNCRYNLLTELDFTNNPNIINMNAEYNSITELDLSGNPMLESLTLNDNQLVSLNVQSGNNAVLSSFVAFNNPNLNCIQVDDPAAASNNVNWLKDSTTVYSLDCALGIADSAINTMQLYPNPVSSVLNVQSQKPIKSFQLYDTLGKVIFSSEENSNQIDFSSYSNGLYFLKIKTDSGSVVEKVLKE